MDTTPTTTETPHKPLPPSLSGALFLLDQARQASAHEGELLKLIMAGTLSLDSWLIKNRLFPSLQEERAKTLCFSLACRNQEPRSACITPLPDGSAFACDVSGNWSALERRQALDVIEHIGFRYAPENRWFNGFQAVLEILGQAPAPLAPFELASLWEAATGAKPHGFATGLLDQMEAFSLEVISKAFPSQGVLGL